MVYFPLIMTLIAGCFDQYLFLICLFTKTADYERYIMFFQKKKKKRTWDGGCFFVNFKKKKTFENLKTKKKIMKFIFLHLE